MQINLKDGTSNFQIFFLLTITGTSLVNTFGDFSEYQELKKQNELTQRSYVSFEFIYLIEWYHEYGTMVVKPNVTVFRLIQK